MQPLRQRGYYLGVSRPSSVRGRPKPMFLWQGMSLFLLAGVLAAQNPSSDWIQPVREAINRKQLAVALDLVDHRLAEQPADWEAHGWRGRLLAWTGHWQDAEVEYRL